MDSPAIQDARVAKEGFWRELCPGLSIGKPSGIISNVAVMQKMGYAYFTGYDDSLAPLARRVGVEVRRLVEMGWPPVFIFLYDQAWDCFGCLHYPILDFLSTYAYQRLPNFWAWRIGPGGGGWKPHRDRGRASLDPSGRPKSMTAWIPLSKANVGNSCIHILSLLHDQTYGTEKEETFEIDPSKAVALELQPGNFAGWNQSVVHWGSAAGPCPEGPRISMSMEFQRADVPPFESPVSAPEAEVTFRMRLWLVARQILQYVHMEKLPREFLELAEKVYTGDV